MSNFVRREVYYFDEPGEQNTDLVIEAVVKRLEAGGVRKVIVGSNPVRLLLSSLTTYKVRVS